MIFVNTLSPEARQALEDLTQHAPGRVAQRAWMVLWSAEQVPVSEIAYRLHCQRKTVRKWLCRYQREPVAGLLDGPRAGRPRTLTAGAEQAILTQVNCSARGLRLRLRLLVGGKPIATPSHTLLATRQSLAGAARAAQAGLSLPSP
jgi:hypothetical protein